MKKLLLILTVVHTLTVAHGQINVALTGTGITCAGLCDGTATATPSGGSAPYTYFWTTSPAQTTNTIINLCAGTYTVIVSDAIGATGTGTVTLTQPTVLSVMVSSTPASCNGCCDGSATGTVSGGTAPYTYQWYPNGSITANANNLCAGSYTLCITDANGCYTCVVATITQPPLGLLELNSSTGFSIYPNPFSSQTILQMSAKRAIPQGGTDNPFHNATLTVDNCFGQTVKQIKNISGQTITFSRDNLASGLYFLRLTENNQTLAVDKLVITDK